MEFCNTTSTMEFFKSACGQLFLLASRNVYNSEVLLSSVGRVGVPFAEALERTRVQLLAWVPLLRVTPLSFPVILFSCTINKAIKRPKKYFKKRKVYNPARWFTLYY